MQKSQPGDPVFLLFPSEVTLAQNATARMHLWCLPNSDGDIADKLTLTLSDNPKPLEIKLAALCVAPKLRLQRESIMLGRVLTGHIAKESVVCTQCLSY